MRDAGLEAAYRATEYRVFAEIPFSLRIDRFEPALAALLSQSGVTQAAYMTACNPGSHVQPDAANIDRMHALRADLKAAAYRFLEGAAVDPAGNWPNEPSLLVLGIEADAARIIGRHFGQNALLLIGSDATPRLDWLI
jgi:hypothetical protein